MTAAPDPTAQLQKTLQELQPSRNKIKLLPTFDAMKIVGLSEAIDLLAEGHGMREERERFMRILRVRLFTPVDDRYFYDPSFNWSSRFDKPVYYSKGDPVPFSISCSEKETGRYASLPMAKGYYRGLSCNVADVWLKYDRSLDAVTFCFLFRLGLRIQIKELRRGGVDYVEKDIPSAFASLPFRYDVLYTTLIFRIQVPLSLLYTLVKRKSMDKFRRVFIKKEEDETVEYDIWNPRYEGLSGQYAKANPYSYTFKYPRSFIEWISQNGLRIFAILRDGDCRIDDRVRLAIKSSMINLDILELSSFTRTPSKQEIEQKSALTEQAMKIREDDRKRLREVRFVKGTLSYSQWAERLWFKSKGAVLAFFERMEEKVTDKRRSRKAGKS